MAKRKESVERWVMVNGQGDYSRDEFGSQFSEELADAYVFIEKPRKTEAVRPVDVTVSIKRSDGG